MAHDVFLSYSTKDKIVADAVCAKLEENEIRIWIAPRDVPAGANFAGAIVEAIDACKIFVLIWSSDANVSKHILNELNRAFDQGIIIIPFRIQDVQPTSAMSYYIGNTHWLDAINPPLETHIAILKDNILANLGREPQPGSPATKSEETAGISELENEGVIERSKKAKRARPSSQKKTSSYVDKEIHAAGTAPAKRTRTMLLAAVGLAIITVGILLISGVFKTSIPAGIAEPLPSKTPSSTAANTLIPTSTVWPTRTATPEPDWIDDFSEPILAAINIQPPDFVDDFSSVDPRWQYFPVELNSDTPCSNTSGAIMGISDGSLKITVNPYCPQGIIVHQDMKYDNYALQVDFNLFQTSGVIDFRAFSPSKELGFFLYSSGNWSFEEIEQGEFLHMLEGKFNEKPFGSGTVTIINECPVYLVYLNSLLLAAYNNLGNCGGPTTMDFNMTSVDQITTIEVFELDNVKIWNLDNIE